MFTMLKRSNLCKKEPSTNGELFGQKILTIKLLLSYPGDLLKLDLRLLLAVCETILTALTSGVPKQCNNMKQDLFNFANFDAVLV